MQQVFFYIDKIPLAIPFLSSVFRAISHFIHFVGYRAVESFWDRNSYFSAPVVPISTFYRFLDYNT